MDKEKILQRWTEKVDMGAGPDDCWTWKGSKDKGGYGKICIERKLYYATQVGWWLHGFGEINDRHLFHTCKNPSCVNPNHLQTRETIWTKNVLTPEEKEERKETALRIMGNHKQQHTNEYRYVPKKHKPLRDDKAKFT